MKHLLTKFFFIASLFFSLILTSQAAETKSAAIDDNTHAVTYTIDPNHTYVLWHINHFGFSNPSGKWLASGTLVLDEKNPKNSKVSATVNTADVITGIAKLDEHLKGKDFFDAEQFPVATFVSNKVELTGKDTAKVEGMLTVHGVSKPVTLNVKLNKMGVSPLNNKKTLGFTASTKLKRSDFGINAYLPGLGDEVKIDIEAEASPSSSS